MKRRHIIAYSAGSLGVALSMQCFNTFVPFLYMDILKLTPTLFATGMFVFTVWNMVNDPLAGQISDRTRTRWGRRIPYIAFLTLPMVVVFSAIWVPPFRGDRGQMTQLFWYFLFTVLLFDGLWTFVVLNWTALFPEMFPEHRDRSEVSGWRQVFSILGLIVGVALPPVVYGSIGWPLMGVAFAVITAATLFVSLLGSKENPQFSRDEGLSLGPALAATFRNRTFLLFLGLNLFINFVFEMLTAGLPFYAKYVLRVGEMETSLLLGVALLAALPMLALWTWVCVRRGSRWALTAAQAAFAVALLPLLVVRGFVAAVLTTTAMGIGFAGLLMLPDVLLADVVDEDELKTGVRREGMFFGMNGFVVRFAIAIKSIAMAVVFNLTGYDATLSVEAQPALVPLGMRALLAVLPVLALGAGLVLTRLYPLHGRRLAEVKAQVAALHEAKAQRLGAGSAEAATP